MDYRSVVLFEGLFIGALYLQRQGRWSLFRKALSGEYKITSS